MEKKANDVFGHIEHPKKRAFLKAFASCGMLTKASKAVDVQRSQVWYWRHKAPGKEEFSEAYDKAYKMASDLLEEEAIRRAKHGLLKKKFHGGQPVIDPSTGEQYEEMEYSDTLLIFLMKGAQPEKYRERFDHRFNIDREFEKALVPFERGRQGEVSSDNQAKAGGSPGGNGKHNGKP